MEFQELKTFVDHHDNFEIRVIGHAGSQFYQVELEDIEGQRHMLTRQGKPVLFRALDDVYLELKRAGIHRAYLVQQVPHDEVIGRETHYQDPLTSRMPLVF
ncbi:DUF6482 family protein [Halomonas daqiaonensis]|uniref:Uncharacterized protein n=1 Tax=Halomonas daqiaonensis TaxID=650850 RepID=A0A1H7N3U7_9GAMM|nr:DUF6482 family protein [Halomonas daqiaonensis]SEL17625.1 hypothetical protein SAMN04488129_107139 [Halomonas daqiaonensis]